MSHKELSVMVVNLHLILANLKLLITEIFLPCRHQLSALLGT